MHTQTTAPAAAAVATEVGTLACPPLPAVHLQTTATPRPATPGPLPPPTTLTIGQILLTPFYF